MAHWHSAGEATCTDAVYTSCYGRRTHHIHDAPTSRNFARDEDIEAGQRRNKNAPGAGEIREEAGDDDIFGYNGAI